MTFQTWIRTFLREKGIDPETTIEVEGPSGPNVIPIGMLVSMMVAAPKSEREAIKRAIVALDFCGRPIVPYLAHLARAVAL